MTFSGSVYQTQSKSEFDIQRKNVNNVSTSPDHARKKKAHVNVHLTIYAGPGAVYVFVLGEGPYTNTCIHVKSAYVLHPSP